MIEKKNDLEELMDGEISSEMLGDMETFGFLKEEEKKDESSTAEVFKSAETEITETETAGTEVPADAEESEMAEEPAEPEVIESMDDYKDLLEASYRRVRPGDVMEGKVIGVNETGVLLDLNYFAPGFVPVDELSADPSFSIMQDVHVGDEMTAVVTKADDGAGNVLMSKKEADSELSWDKLKRMKEEQTVVAGKITETVPKGAIMYVEGIRGFIPASRLDLQFVENTEEYLNKVVSVRVYEVDEEDEKLILSAREILTEAAVAEKNAKISRMEPGAVVEGTVELIKDYGAFVSIGDGISGLLHVSQITEKRIKHPGAVLKVGQKVKVLITKIENGKISLSMKALADVLNKEKAEEEPEEYSDNAEASTSLADLLKGFKL